MGANGMDGMEGTAMDELAATVDDAACGGCAGCGAGVDGADGADGAKATDSGRGASRRDFLRQGALALALLAGTRLPLTATQPAVRFGRGLRRRDGGLVYPVPDKDGATVDRRYQVILVRWQGSLYAFALSCPHQNTALHWEEANHRFQCRKHHSKYRPDGTFISGRATRGMDRYALALTEGKVTVDTGMLYKQDEDPDGWNAAVVRLSATTQQTGGVA